MRHSLNLRTALVLTIPLVVSSCAISSNFGESDLISVKEKFGLELPTNPVFALKNLGSDRYYLAVHQSGVLIAEGATRARFLRIAGERIASEECKSLGKDVLGLQFRQRGDTSWVSLVGEFACGYHPLPAPLTVQNNLPPSPVVSPLAPKDPLPTPPIPPPLPKDLAPVAALEPMGTGFFVNATGDLVTNKHVIDGCSTFVIVTGNAQRPATLRASDAAMDLAVLSVNMTPTAFPQIRSARADKLGETVVVAGYPLQGLLGSGLNITTGTVSALAGLGNNTRVLQITAPVQQGNSGGPLLDENGAIAGVVVSKLNAGIIAKLTGDIPQNVNFAIKSSVLRGFLEANGVEYSVTSNVKKALVVDIAERAKAFTLPVLCRKK